MLFELKYASRGLAVVLLPLLAACVDDMFLDEGTKRYLSMNAASGEIMRASDQDAAAMVRRAWDDETVLAAALVGLWQDRPALVTVALQNGLDPARPIPNADLLGYPSNPGYPGPLTAAYSMANPPEQTPDMRAILAPRELARTKAGLDALIAGGAQYDAASLADALYVAVAFGREVELAETLVAMGARLDAPAGPGRMPLMAAAVMHGSPAVVAWALDQGLDPNMTLAHRGPKSYAGTEGVRTFHYSEGLTPLHAVVGYTPDPALRARAVEMARVLVAAGADVNATATYAHSVGEDRPVEGWTPLHSASLYVEEDYGNPDLVAYLLSAGADPEARTSAGDAPRDVAGMIGRVSAQLASAEAAIRQERLQRQAQAGQSGSDDDGGDFFGQMMAAAGMLAVASGAMNAGVDGGTAAQIAGAGLLDIFTDGEAGATTAATQQIRSQAAQNRQAQAPTAQQAAAGGGFQTESYALQCPSGVSNTIPLRYRTQQCRAAMIDFARAYACNDYNRFEAVQASCQAACGSPTCEQK